MPPVKSGPLSRAEIQAIWEGSADKAYVRPFVEAGDGQGFEVWSQFFAQLERASKAIDVTTQALYISPWSGQSNPPAGGAALSRVELTITRSKLLDRPLVLGAGIVLAQEVTTDASETGPVVVRTGRRYALAKDVVFHPGEQGPVTVEADAEFPGYGFDNPLPGTISELSQVGSGLNNDLATVAVVASPAAAAGPPSTVRLVADAQADMFVPEHVGQYVAFLAGLNAGSTARIVGFEQPKPLAIPPLGSVADLELFFSVHLTGVSGGFVPGEQLSFSSGGFGTAVGDFSPVTNRLGFDLRNGTTPAAGDSVIGAQSGATGTIDVVLAAGTYAAEAPVSGVGGATWTVLDWAADWGVTVANALSPAGGRMDLLDALGAERAIGRAPGEDDESYRARVREIADVVTPNAIRRALNRTLPGFPWCFREVGSSFLPGWFYDGDLSPAGGTSNSVLASANKEASYDEDVILLDGIPTAGMSFDAGFDAYDSGMFPMFWGPPETGNASFIGIPGDHERVVLEDPDFNVYATGYFGRIDPLSPPAPPAMRFVFVRLHGRMPDPIPGAGLRVRGVTTGALFAVTSGFVPATAISRRFRRYLDYEQFRAFFLVGVPRLAIGEFGFSFDAGQFGGFDTAPFPDFWDGFALQAARLYQRVYYAVNAARAGGVGFELYVEDIGCP
jgi:hypothetical protein